MKEKISTKQVAFCGILAAIYAALTIATAAFAYGPIQFRLAEALCILPFFLPFSTWGLFIGCVIANLFSTVSALDIVIGSLATLLAACITAKLPAKWKWLAPLPPVLSNALIIGTLLGWYSAGFGSAFPAAFAFNALTVGLGELIACYVFGGVLLIGLPRLQFFRQMLPADRV